MIGSLHGRLTLKEADRVILQVGGVGYLVAIPFSTFYVLGDVGCQVDLRIHTVVREDLIALFGFGTDIELHLFQKLIAVSGIGPRMAINTLSGMAAAELIDALRGGDVKRLTRVPGLGRKTAERLILELKDKLDAIAIAPKKSAAGDASLRDDAVSALINLGWRQKDAEAACDQVPVEAMTDLESLLKSALVTLAR